MAKVEALMKHGESMDSAMHTDILLIMTDKTDEIRKTYAEYTYVHIANVCHINACCIHMTCM